MQFHWKQSHQQNAWSAKLDQELNFFEFSNVLLLLGTYQKECDSQWKCRRNVDEKVLECLECAQSLAVAVGEVRKLTQNFISIVDTKYRLCQLSI